MPKNIHSLMISIRYNRQSHGIDLAVFPQRKPFMNPKTKSFWQDSKGLTLVEVMLSVALFAIGILGIFSLHGVTVVTNDRSHAQTIARALALAKIEHLQSLPGNSPQLTNCGIAYDPNGDVWCIIDATGPSGNGYLPAFTVFPSPPYDPDIPPGGVVATLDETGIIDPNGRFRRYWHVEPAASGFPNAVNVRVRVDWRDLNMDIARGRIRNITYETMLVF